MNFRLRGDERRTTSVRIDQLPRSLLGDDYLSGYGIKGRAQVQYENGELDTDDSANDKEAAPASSDTSTYIAQGKAECRMALCW